MTTIKTYFILNSYNIIAHRLWVSITYQRFEYSCKNNNNVLIENYLYNIINNTRIFLNVLYFRLTLNGIRYYYRNKIY